MVLTDNCISISMSYLRTNTYNKIILFLVNKDNKCQVTGKSSGKTFLFCVTAERLRNFGLLK